VLSGKWWLAAPAFIGQAFRAGLGLAVIVLTLQDKELSVFHAKHGYIVYATVITSAVVRSWSIGTYTQFTSSYRLICGTRFCCACICAGCSHRTLREPTYPFKPNIMLKYARVTELPTRFTASCSGLSVRRTSAFAVGDMV
jgi:hypothetical protein